MTERNARKTDLAGGTPAPPDDPKGGLGGDTGDDDFRLRTARRYASRFPGAVSGQAGHARAFGLACELVNGFGLTRDDARVVMREWNARCEPPWSDAELDHKLDDAEARDHDRPRGWRVSRRR